MKKWLAGALLLGYSSVLYCQTSAYQDADGTSSIFLANAKASLTYNVSDSKFNIGYLYEPAATKVPDFEAQLAQDLLHISKLEDKLEDAKNTIKDQTELKTKTDDYQKKLDDYKADADRLRAEIKANPKSHCWTGCEFGISLTGKPESDLTGQILQSGKTPADFGGGFLIGRHGIGAKDIFSQGPMDVLRDDWFLVNVTYDRSTFNTVATGATTAVAQHFNGFTILPVYNVLLNIPGFSFLGGVGAGVNRTNNTSDLKKVQISTSQSSSGSVSVVSQSSAFLGTYQEAIGVPVYSDFVFIPKKLPWLGIDAFQRSNVAAMNRSANGGVGLYFAKPSNPTAVLGGLSVGWKDGKATASIVAGWSF